MRSIAHLSDLHFGRHDDRAVEGLVATLDTLRPDLVVVSGDFTQRAHQSEFALARQFLDRITRPKLVVPGNHDVPLYDMVARFFTPLMKYDRYLSPVGPSAFVDDEIAAFGLNTARSFTIKDGRVSLDQIGKIRKVFEDIPANVIKILVTHHPLGSPRDNPSVELAGRSLLARTTIAELGIHLLLSGHYHRAASGPPLAEIQAQGGVLVVHAGTATSTRTRYDEANSFNLLTIERNRLDVRIFEWISGSRFQEAGSKQYEYRNSRWFEEFSA